MKCGSQYTDDDSRQRVCKCLPQTGGHFVSVLMYQKPAKLFLAITDFYTKVINLHSDLIDLVHSLLCNSCFPFVLILRAIYINVEEASNVFGYLLEVFIVTTLRTFTHLYGKKQHSFLWACYQILKIAGCACAGCWEPFCRHRELAILACITARA